MLEIGLELIGRRAVVGQQRDEHFGHHENLHCPSGEANSVGDSRFDVDQMRRD